MEVLVIINKVLDLKIVQWALLATVVALLGMGIYLELKVGSLKVEKAFYVEKYSQASSGLATQNEAVERLGEETRKLQKNLESAADKASKIALENAKTLRGILDSKLTGTCDEKVTQTLEMIRGK